MHRCGGYRVWLVVAGCVALTAAIWAQSPDGPADGKVRAAIVYPANGSVIKSELALVMVVAPADQARPAVTLDGKPIEVEPMRFARTWAFRDARLYAATRPVELPGAELLKHKADKMLLLAAVKLAPGEHVIGAGPASAKVFAAPTNPPVPPAGWPVFHPHQPVKDATEALACQSCHEMTGEKPERVLGLCRVPSSCHTCHEEVEAQLAHRHVMEPLAKCATCHDAHGATRERLLIAPQETLCTQCHEGGHSIR